MAVGGNAVLISLASEFDSKGIREAQKQLAALEKNLPVGKFQKFGEGLQSLGGRMTKLGGSFTKNLTLPIVGIGVALGAFAKGAEEAEIANRKLDAVLTEMGFGDATARVSAYAEELERSLAIDADVIKATQTKLATFKELTATVDEQGGAFDRATMAALNMAAAGFGEATGNAVQLGKALNDPIKGITAMGRAGVTFTEQEKEKIKVLVESGNLLEAQNMVLSAIEGQLGNTAEASASSFTRIKLSLMQVADTIGLAVLPLIESLADFIANKLVPFVVPKIEKMVEKFSSLSPAIKGIILGIAAFLAALGPVLMVFGKMTSGIGSLIVAMSRLDVAMLRTRAASIATFVTNPAFLVIGAIVLSIAALVAIFTKAYKESEILRDAVSEAFNMIKNAISSAIKIVRDALERNSLAIENLQVSFKALGDFIGKFIVPIFSTFLSSAIESTAKVIAGAIDLIAKGITLSVGLINQAISIAQSAINGFIKGFNLLGSAIANVTGKSFTPLTEVIMPRLAIVTGEATKQTREFRDSQESAGKAAESVTPKIKELEEKIKDTGGSAKKAAKEVNKSFDEIKKALVGLVGDLKSFGAAGGGFDVVGLGIVEGIINGLNAGKKKISDAAKSTILEAIDQVKNTVKEASDLAKSVSDTLFGFLSISDAFDSFTKRQTDATESLQKLRDFQADLGEEATESQLRQLAKLQDEYHKAQEAAANGSQNVVEEFIQQAERFKEFGEKMRRLLALGLNQQSFMDIMKMGADRGGQVADAFLNGNTSELIARTNATVSEYRQFADNVGMGAAQTFFESGISSAVQMLTGLIQELLPKGKLRNQLMRVMDNLAASLNRTSTLTIMTRRIDDGGGGIPSGAMADISPSFIPSPFAPGVPVVDIGPGFFQGIFDAATPFADGGIVTRPMMGLIGEAGPEAVIPLNRANGMMGSTYNIVVNPGLSTDAETGRAVVEAIKRYERTSGQIFANA